MFQLCPLDSLLFFLLIFFTFFPPFPLGGIVLLLSLLCGSCLVLISISTSQNYSNILIQIFKDCPSKWSINVSLHMYTNYMLLFISYTHATRYKRNNNREYSLVSFLTSLVDFLFLLSLASCFTFTFFFGGFLSSS